MVKNMWVNGFKIFLEEKESIHGRMAENTKGISCLAKNQG
jgi:hypothetical protein